MAGSVLRYRGFRPFGVTKIPTKRYPLSATNTAIGKGGPVVATGAGADALTATGVATATPRFLGFAVAQHVSGATRTAVVTPGNAAYDPSKLREPLYSDWVEVWDPRYEFLAEFDEVTNGTNVVVPADCMMIYSFTANPHTIASTGFSQAVVDVSTRTAARSGALEMIRLIGIPDMPENDPTVNGTFITGIFTVSRDVLYDFSGVGF